MDEKKCIPKGACYGCLQRGAARALQIQRQMIQPSIGLGVRSPMEELEGGPEELKGKNNNISHPEAPELPGTKPSTKEHTRFQPKESQRNALSGISGR